MAKAKKNTKTVSKKSNKTVAKTTTKATAKKNTKTTAKTAVKTTARGRMPLWASTKPKRAYVLAMRTAGKPYSNEAYPAYRKALMAKKG